MFVRLKWTYLVTLFGRNFQVFKNSQKLTIFGTFNQLLAASLAMLNETFSVIFKHRAICTNYKLILKFFQAKRVSSSTNLTGPPALPLLLPPPSLVVPPPPKALVMLLTRRVTCKKARPPHHNQSVSTIPVVVPMQMKNPRKITKIPTPSKATPPPLIQS